MTVFRAATLRTFFFAFHAGAKELKEQHEIFPLLYNNAPYYFDRHCANKYTLHTPQYLHPKRYEVQL